MPDSIHTELAEAVIRATSALRKAIAAAHAGGLRIDVSVAVVEQRGLPDPLPEVNFREED